VSADFISARDRCFKPRNLGEIRLNTSGFQVAAEVPVEDWACVANGLVNPRQIVVTSPLPARATSPPLASRTLRSDPMSRAARWSKFRFFVLENIEAMDLTLFQTWDAQHIAEILYLQYLYLVVYSDDGWLIACRPMICSLWENLSECTTKPAACLSAGER
jgi:hypothetical protein